MNKLALGTVQFGLRYGINNQKGKISRKEVYKILDYAWKNSIDILDTAYEYGDSEEIIGEYQPHRFKIVSKLPSTALDKVKSIFTQSLNRLKIDNFYGYLIHDFKFFTQHLSVWNILKQFKQEKKVQKIGFSLYYPQELDCIFEKKIEFDIIQIPYSIFDQRFSTYFSKLKEKNVEIHTRSAFLQGLVFKQLDYFDSKFRKLKPKIERINNIVNILHIPLSALYLNFSVANQHIDKVVIGVDSLENLQENVNNLKFLFKIKNNIKKLEKLKVNDENIIIPYNWS